MPGEGTLQECRDVREDQSQSEQLLVERKAFLELEGSRFDCGEGHLEEATSLALARQYLPRNEEPRKPFAHAYQPDLAIDESLQNGFLVSTVLAQHWMSATHNSCKDLHPRRDCTQVAREKPSR